MDFSTTTMTRKIERSVKLKAGQLIPNPWNPYRNKSDRLQEAIAESIGEFDQIQDIVCRPHPTSPGKYEILDGEGRHRTFDADADVFVTIVHGLTEAQARKITIVMDETRATADQDLLSGLLAELAEEYSIDDLLTGLPYDDNQLSEMIKMGGDFDGMASDSGNPVRESDKTLAEVEQNAADPEYVPRVKAGEIWKLGRHYVACGDCTIEGNVRSLMAAADCSKVEMVWADPPYGYSYQSNWRKPGKQFEILENDDRILKTFVDPASKVSSGWFLVCTTWKVVEDWIRATKSIGELTNVLVWDKGGGGMGDLTHSLSTDYELILAFGRGANIQGERLGSVWAFNKDRGVEYLHPTQKPVALARQALECFSMKGVTVLDPFLGSGMSLIAAEELGDRTVIGFELSAHYCSIICDRWERLTGSTAELIGSLGE